MELLRPFKKLNKTDANIAGGKGASLGEMIQANIPVPDGFVVLSTTFDTFLQETDLTQEIASILETVDHKEIHTVENASEKIQGLIKSVVMPENIAKEIKEQFKHLDAKYVAVRSSATAEDGQDHAWAGQLDSFLNTTEKDLLEKVQRCWASLFTPRAIFYRFEKGLYTTQISVAVVVQKMINSEISGIAFSVHPVTEDKNQLIIEAGFGLGEAIVSGSITPDSYVVEKEPRKIIDTNIATQNRGLYRLDNGGNKWLNIAEPKASSQVLDNKQVLELSDIILGIEDHYGFPCDIEWAYEGGKFYIVQSRPITTLSKKAIVSQELTFVSPELKGFNPSEYHFDGLWKNDLFSTCFWQDCWVPGVVKELNLDLEGVGVMNLKGGHFLVHKPTRERMDKQIKKMMDEKNVKFFKNLIKVSDEVFSWAVEKGESIRTKEPTVQNFEEFVSTAKKLNFLWLIGAVYTNWPVEEKLQEAVIEDKFPAEHVLDIVPKIVTPLHDYQNGLPELKMKIGDRTFAEVEKDHKLFKELQNYAEKYIWVEIFNFIGEPLTVERLYEQIGHLEHKEHSHAYKPSEPISKKLKFATECLHDVGYVKQCGAEYFSIFAEKTLPFLNTIAKKIGVTYREFMCLSTNEIDQALQEKISSKDLKDKAARRIGVNDWAAIGSEDGTMILIEEISDIKLLMEKMIPRTGKDAKELIGKIGNRGKYTGPVRIVMNTYDFDKVQQGDVLVTTMTTPDFIVLMQKSGAIVTDIGGLLCHAAIVSREMNKPCVIGTKFATQVLKDNDMVEVDADNGIVRKI